MKGRYARLLAAALLLAAAGRPAAHGAELAVVRVGTLGLMSDAGLYVAMEKGYFQDEGIRVDLQRFASGAKMVPALVAGELDVAGGAATAGLFNAMAGGGEFKIVADKGQIRPGHEINLLVLRKDLVDSGALRSPADLRGRRVAHPPGPGVVSQYFLWHLLDHAGVPWDAVARVDVAPPNHVAMLATKQVDAVMSLEPFGARAERDGVGVRLPVTRTVKVLERLQSAVFIYSDRFMSGRRDAAKGWLRAYVKGSRFVHQRGVKDDEVVGILLKYVRVTAEDIRESWPPYLSPDGRPDVASLAAQQEWYFRMGMLERRVPMERAVDLGFLP